MTAVEEHWTTNAPPESERTLAPQHRSSTVPADYRTVNGWGVDLHERPMFPKELPSTVTHVRGEVKHWQVPHTRVHQSVEHPNRTPVFGTSAPPHGLSGALRDYAYQFGEAANRHWLTLMLADRIDILEHLFGDAVRGRPDNYIKEKGWTAKLKYEPGRERRILTLGAIALGAVAVGIAVSKWREED